MSKLSNLLKNKYMKKKEEVKSMPAYKMKEIIEKKQEKKDKSNLSVVDRLENIRIKQNMHSSPSTPKDIPWGDSEVNISSNGEKDFIPMTYDEKGEFYHPTTIYSFVKNDEFDVDENLILPDSNGNGTPDYLDPTFPEDA
jgi:hypothetical protein